MKFFTQLLALCSFMGIWAQQTYLHCGQLIDTESGKVLKEQTIIINDKMIVSVEKGFLTPDSKDDRVIDLRSKTVLPGLIDMHVHIEEQFSPNTRLEGYILNEADVALNAVGYARATLMAGFTTVRDLGGSGVNISVRNSINSGKIVGPRIFTAGQFIASTGGHGDPTNGANRRLIGDPGPKEGVVNSIDDAKKAVRQRYKNGADLIKITATGGVLSVAKSGDNPQFTIEEIEEICKTAKGLWYACGCARSWGLGDAKGCYWRR
jgi:imidazolonepropionase-like amidohydrolase